MSKTPRTSARHNGIRRRAGRDPSSPLTFKHTKTNKKKKRKKLKPSESASLSPRRVIKAFWQSEVVFILVCVVLLL